MKKLVGIGLLHCGILLLMFVSDGLSADYYVTNPATFQAALDSAEGNNTADTIYVAAGTYNLINTLTYTFKEQYPLTIVGDGAATTILDGGAIPSTNTFHSIIRIEYDQNSPIEDEDSDVTINGLTFQNGSGESGGGLYFYPLEADLTVENCIFDNNTSDLESGGGLYAFSSGKITLQSNILTSNTSEYSGGGIYIYGSNVLLEDNTFSGNTSANFGGGSYIHANEILVNGNTFDSNSSENSGAALYVDSSVPDIGEYMITNNIFSNNNVTAGSGYGTGGAYISALQKTTTIAKNSFISNSGYYGGGLEVHSRYELTLDSNKFLGNSARFGGGAYIGTNPGSTNKIINNSFVNNLAESEYYGDGGGLYLQINNSTVTVTNNTFTRNDSTGTEYPMLCKGGGLYIEASSYDGPGIINLYNNIVWGNSAELVDGKDIYISSSYLSTIVVVDVYNNDVHELFSDIVFTESNTIDLNPDFVDAPNNDIHLLSTSLCRDAGNDSAPELPALDFEEDSRIVGDHVDIGADEYTVNAVDQGDVNGDDSVNLLDVIISLQMVAGKAVSAQIFPEADVNDDQKIGLEEAIFSLDEYSKND